MVHIKKKKILTFAKKERINLKKKKTGSREAREGSPAMVGDER